jgi:L-iditol 2-dehydrogenase
MKAVQKVDRGNGFLECRDIPEPSAGPGKIKIKVAYCGICGSDLHIVEGFEPPNASYPFPVTLGHEYSGTVVEVGEGVTQFAVGDRVTSNVSTGFCGKCYQCLSGNYYACPGNRNMGYETDGFMAEYAAVDAGIAFKLPDNISFEEGAQVEPACVAAFATLEKVNLKPTDTCVVFGAGAIGLLTLQFLKLCGSKVIVADLSSVAGRLELAVKYGADLVIENDKVDAMAEIRKATGGAGADYIFECTAAEPCINLATLTVKRGGTVVMLGITAPTGTTFKYYLLSMLQGNTIINSFGHRLHTWPRVISLIAEGKISVKDLVTHKFTFEQFEEAFGCKDPGKIKVLLHP